MAKEGIREKIEETHKNHLKREDMSGVRSLAEELISLEAGAVLSDIKGTSF